MFSLLTETAGMHRVFQSRAGITADPADTFAGLRAFLCSLGLIEEPSGNCFLYLWPHPAGNTRQFATLQGSAHSATVYLYPDALGRAPGYAAHFYRALDDAGLGMGSKLGPSIGIDLGDATQVRLFHEGLAALFVGIEPSV